MSKKFTIAIIDYDMGNVKSIENSINHIGDFDIIITSKGSEINQADCLILPGVGAFPDAIAKLKEKDLINILNNNVINNKKPLLGICLGMQLLFDDSEEINLTQGLGWIPGNVVYMRPKQDFRVPHIGWNTLNIKNDNSIFDYLTHDKDFYFVHSLHVKCEAEYVLATFDYGATMVASVQKDNVIGMQFHPEKSQKVGLNAMRSFLSWAEKYTSDKEKVSC